MTSDPKVLRIGIASADEMRDWTLTVVRGQHKVRPDEPKVWFSCLESLAQVLSAKNRLLIEIIRQESPASLAELAKLSGRAESNLSRTLRTLAHYNLLRLNKGSGRRLVPEVPYDCIVLDLQIAATAWKGRKPARRRTAA